MKKAVIVISLLPISLYILYQLFNHGILQMNHPNKKTYPVRGIDISHHQKEIDWEKLKQEHFNLIFIKATEGGDFKDPNFLKNWNKARDIGLYTSAYHFYTLCRSPLDQAENYINTVPLSEKALPPAIDLEFGGNCKKRPRKKEFLMGLNQFIKIIKEKYHRKPILYLTLDFYEYYFKNQEVDGYFWIRNIYYEPKIKWHFWQYSNRGKVRGIETFVDLNVFNGSVEELKQLK